MLIESNVVSVGNLIQVGFLLHSLNYYNWLVFRIEDTNLRFCKRCVTPWTRKRINAWASNENDSSMWNWLQRLPRSWFTLNWTRQISSIWNQKFKHLIYTSPYSGVDKTRTNLHTSRLQDFSNIVHPSSRTSQEVLELKNIWNFHSISCHPIGHFPRTYRHDILTNCKLDDKVRLLVRKDLVS